MALSTAIIVGTSGLLHGADDRQTAKLQASKSPPPWLALSLTVKVHVPYTFSPSKLESGSIGM